MLVGTTEISKAAPQTEVSPREVPIGARRRHWVSAVTCCEPIVFYPGVGTVMAKKGRAADQVELESWLQGG